MMLLSTRKIAATVAVALPVALAAPTAQAAFVEVWQYDVQSAFSAFEQEQNETGGTGVVGTQPNANLGGQPTNLSWGPADTGAGGERSSISVTPSVSGNNLVTNGDAVGGASFFHDNDPIADDSQSLIGASLLNRVTLTPFVPAADSPANQQSFDFVVDFMETSNDGSCLAESQSNCDDIFVLSNPDSQLSYDFEYDDILYTVSLDIAGLMNLSADACAEANAAPGCVGLLTQENRVNEIRTSFFITASRQAAVPEPGALSIMGLGLVGLAAIGFRRNRQP